MGTKVAPLYATLSLGYLEKSIYTIIKSKYGPFMKDFSLIIILDFWTMFL